MAQPTLTSQWKWTTPCLCERIVQMKSHCIDGKLLAAEASRRAGGQAGFRSPRTWRCLCDHFTALKIPNTFHQRRHVERVCLTPWCLLTLVHVKCVCVCFLFRTNISCTHRPNEWVWKKDALLKTNIVMMDLLCEPSTVCFDAPADVRQSGPDNTSALHILTPPRP